MNQSLGHLVAEFFTAYLSAERGLSPHTIASYADCMRALVGHLCRRHRLKPEDLRVSSVDREDVLAFLDSMEKERGNGPSTRNQRLAAIKTFLHYLARKDPSLMGQNERVQSIRAKKTQLAPPPSLSHAEVDAILAVPDPATPLGARDRALMLLLYNTGARVQELADMRMADMRLDAPACVTLTGKGRKTRVIPVWPETTAAIRRYIESEPRRSFHCDRLFLSAAGLPLTRFGIGRRVARLAAAAAVRCASLRGRNIGPHTFRHTTALHLLEAGNDIAVVKDWLGHADIKTTSMYLEVSLDRKRRALQKLPPPDGGQPPEPRRWKQPGVFAFLKECSRAPRYVAPFDPSTADMPAPPQESRDPHPSPALLAT